MKNELFSLLITFFIVILYLLLSLKVLIGYFAKISQPMTTAMIMLFSATLFGFGYVFYGISDAGLSAFYFLAKEGIFKASLYWLIFAAAAFVFSLGLFFFSHYITSIVTEENERAELAKNNLFIASIHSIIFILVCITLVKPFNHFISAFVPYPAFPN